MTKYQSYSSRHAKQQPRSFTPNPHSTLKVKSTSVSQNKDLIEELDRKASKIELAIFNQRFLQMQNKMNNLTNIVKLVQKYTQAQDIQYQKQKQMIVGRQSMLNGLVADHQEMMRKQQAYLLQIQQTQRRIREHGSQQIFEQVGQRIRKEMNMKIQIVINELNNVKKQKQYGDSNASFQRMQMDETKQRLTKLQNTVMKALSKKEFVKFKSDVNEQIQNVTERFTKLIKKYMSTSAGTPTKSPTNKYQKAQVNEFTLQKKQKSTNINQVQEPRKIQKQKIKDQKPKVLSKSKDKTKKVSRNSSQQNIHPNIRPLNSPISRSRSKSKEKSLNKNKNPTLERKSSVSPKPKVSDKRKQKQIQLRQIIKHSKNQKSLR